MNFAIVIAIISPFIYGFINTFDKYVVSHKVKNTFAYSAVSGVISMLLGLVIALFLTWNNISIYSLIFPALAGICSGVAYYIYFFIMKNSDASYVVGFLYLFPIVVAILSFIFLGEKLPILAYLAVIIILGGIIALSVRAKKIKMGLILLPFIVYILIIGGYEFFIKVATNNVSFLQGLAITIIVSSFTILSGLFSKKIRKDFTKELKNIKYALVSESVTIMALLTLYFSISKLSVTIVSSLGAIQPLAVLIFERIAHSRFGNITKDIKLLPKLGAIILIIIGVILLTIFTT
jgi:drug/metabolite transporter (DMT)-like permease